MLQTGEVFAGYVIRRVLGQGGMGTVYLAQHPRLPRLTALKLLKRELYTELEIRRRFEREADLAAGLDHPNIVTVFDRGAQDEQLWISMQYVPGADASCADVNVLEPGRAVQIVGDTANALDFAHANRVLHRDVKPANILLAKAPIGQHERVLLTDFGIASVRGSDTTLGSSGSITATLAFGAPEQLLGRPLDDRADQYSLACTLFWMLTGAPPYPGANPAAVVHSHLHAPVPTLSRIRPGLPPALDRVLARALAKHPADRYPSCAEFAAAAKHALTTAPHHQPPYPHNAPRPPATRTLPPHAAAWSSPLHPQHIAPTRQQPMHSDRTAGAPPNGPATPATFPPHAPDRNPPSPPRPPSPPQPPATTPIAETSGERADRPPGGPSGHGAAGTGAPRIPRSVPPQPFPAPRRPVRRGTIELPDLPRRPGSAGRTQAPPPESRPPPIAVRY
ncbi:protein kinase domain-containing protein [Nocardia brasiliensis]